jgi:hypothetical protein
MTALRCWAHRAMLAGIAALPLLSQAQTSQVRTASSAEYSTPLIGMIRDSSGRPLLGVELRLKGSDDLLARTNDAGGFRIASMPLGTSTIVLRRLGFSPATIDVHLRANTVDSLVISMAAFATMLPGVAATDEHDALSKRLLASFWERRKLGFGSFMTRDEIEHRNATEFTELVRMMPGVRVTNANGRPSIRFARDIQSRDCPPQYVVDGMKIENGSPDEFVPEDVEAIEIYAGPATIPMQFRSRPDQHTCGAVVVWTRLPG